MPNSIWEEIYKAGRVQNYPWDSVVSFVFRNAPKRAHRDEVKILEVGFGTASNLWFCAREGFDVYGVEGSSTAVDVAKSRFNKDGLIGDLKVGDFTSLPFNNDMFDLAIDRAALTCVGKKSHIKAIEEIRRCLNVGGKFFYNCYANNHSSHLSGSPGGDSLTIDISKGSLTDVGPLLFVSRADIDEFFSSGWKVLKITHKELNERLTPTTDIHSEWMVVAEKM
jgi:SAM-dependent methyltransferase